MARRITLTPARTDEEAAPALSIDYAGQLNPQQHAAATAPGGPTLIVAGAGTGKTRTLVYRVAYLVETGTPPENIALLTFTRRAAQEMLARASRLLDGRCQRVEGGTFHAFCLGVLRRHAPQLGFPNRFTVLDASDAADVCGAVRTASGYHKSKERFPRKKTLYNLFSACTNRTLALEDVLEEKYPQFLGFLDELRELQRAYAGYKKKHGLMDFDDLLARTLELFEKELKVRREVSARCRHVLVDEYQDTNALQADLVRALSSVHGNVTVVGDDAQSIYRFRGADFRNIFHFPKQFSGTQVLKLEENYRSTQPILDLANRLIQKARRKYDKKLFTKEKKTGDLPAVVPAADDRMEARFVAQMVLTLREQGVPLENQAVLFRSSYSAYDVEVELGRRGIPFVKYGGMKLSEAAHIKDVLAHLKVAENPQDAAAWNRILQLLHGVGPKTAQDLIAWATEGESDPFAFEESRYSPRYIEALRKLFQLLRTIRDPEAPLGEQVEAVLRYYQPILEEQYFEDYPKREQDLEHFAGLTERFADRTEFLSSLALDPIELTALGAEEAADDEEPPLVLSTIHSAKGLEFDTVFVIQALEGTLPSRYALEDPDAVDEELRLLYVAVTRAEENLFISYPMLRYRRSRGEYLTEPSRFLAGVPESVLEPVELVESHAPPPALEESAKPQLPEHASGNGAAEDAAPEETDAAEIGDDGLPF